MVFIEKGAEKGPKSFAIQGKGGRWQPQRWRYVTMRYFKSSRNPLFDFHTRGATGPQGFLKITTTNTTQGLV